MPVNTVPSCSGQAVLYLGSKDGAPLVVHANTDWEVLDQDHELCRNCCVGIAGPPWDPIVKSPVVPMCVVSQGLIQ